MPPAKRSFQVRDEASGKIYTVWSTSEKTAITAAVKEFGFSEGTYLWAKERGKSQWQRWRV